MRPLRFDPDRAAARAIMVIAGLNLNGVGAMLFDNYQIFSLPLLLLTTYVIARTGAAGLRDRGIMLFVAAIVSYVILALFFSSSAAPLDPYLTVTYLSSILIIFALASLMAGRRSAAEIEADFLFLKVIFLVACGSVWVSPLLTGLYVKELVAEDRNGGFFGNPGEAGIVAATTIALILCFPARSKLANLLHLGIASGAVFLSFSKTSLLVAVTICVVFAFRRGRPLVSLFSIAISVIFVLVADAIVEWDLVDLTSDQHERISDFIALLRGELTEQTTTGRLDIWRIAWDQIVPRLPFGAGLGSFHEIIGGVFENGVWLGVHNTYLMILGEGGIIPLVLMVLAVSCFMVRAFRSRVSDLPLLYCVVLQGDLMGLHTALELRFHDLVLGMVLGLLAWEMQWCRSAAQATAGPAIGALPRRKLLTGAQ